MLDIVIARAAKGRFTASLDGRDLITAKEPFFAAARKLLAEGVDPETLMAMRHQGSATRSITMKVGEAAKLRVIEEDKGGLRIRSQRVVLSRRGHSTASFGDEE
jgi:hypothetical protein